MAPYTRRTLRYDLQFVLVQLSEIRMIIKHKHIDHDDIITLIQKFDECRKSFGRLHDAIWTSTRKPRPPKQAITDLDF